MWWRQANFVNFWDAFCVKYLSPVLLLVSLSSGLWVPPWIYLWNLSNIVRPEPAIALSLDFLTGNFKLLHQHCTACSSSNSSAAATIPQPILQFIPQEEHPTHPSLVCKFLIQHFLLPSSAPLSYYCFQFIISSRGSPHRLRTLDHHLCK